MPGWHARSALRAIFNVAEIGRFNVGEIGNVGIVRPKANMGDVIDIDNGDVRP